MRSPLLIVITAALLLVGCSRADNGSLSFQSPPDWKIEHKAGAGFYKLTGKTPDEASLIFVKSPGLDKPEDIPASVQKLADKFREGAKKAPGFTLLSEEYRIEHFVGEHCHGSYAVFQVTEGGTNSVAAFFTMSVDGRVWFGPFSGSSEAWKQALTVLKSIKKDG